MKLSLKKTIQCIIVFLPIILCTACGVFRGIPSHGGGKRFDEEQRVVSSSIRHAVAKMDINELQGKRVKIVVSSVAHDGGATVYWPGPQDVGISGYPFDEHVYDNYRRLYKEGVDAGDDSRWVASFRDENTFDPATNLNARYRPYMTFSPHRVSSDPDIKYLSATLDMSVRHNGITLADKDSELILFVLVDVLGTNRSRLDTILYSSDELKASCELTYYAQDRKSGKLIFYARRASAAASYSEDSFCYVRLGGDYSVIEDNTPTPLPIRNGISPKAGNGLSDNPPETDEIDKEEANIKQQDYLNTLLKDEELQIEMNKFDTARKNLEQIIAIEPDYPGLSDLFQRIEEKEQDILQDTTKTPNSP